MITLLEPTETKARKQHRCSFCNERIMVGEKYIKSTHVYDGSAYDWKAHKYCNKLAHTLDMFKQSYEGVTQDYFIETVNDTHDEILINQIPKEDRGKYSDIIKQLRRVNFRDKLWFVIRHFNKLEKQIY